MAKIGSKMEPDEFEYWDIMAVLGKFSISKTLLRSRFTNTSNPSGGMGEGRRETRKAD